MRRLCRRNFKSFQAVLILVCNVLLGGTFSLTLTVLLAQPSGISANDRNDLVNVLGSGPYILYIIAGIIADIRFGRYKVIVCSIFVSFALLFISSAASLIYNLTEASEQEWLLWIALGVYSLCFITFTPFQGTILQFGLDQLPEATSDELSSYIHWYVWTSSIKQLPLQNYVIKPSKHTCIILLTVSMVISAGLLILCLALYIGARGCNILFIREPPSRSPYMSVFKVLQFAKNHKIPLHRSAFTYWEGDPPSRLDMGKDKYGGPFTNEQVEDVKTFFRVLYFLACILLIYFVVSISLTPAFLLHFGSAQQSSYSPQRNDPIYLVMADIFCSPALIVVLLIPLHELVLFPLLGNRYLPNMMSKINIAAILISASLTINLIIDGVGHYNQDVQCMFAAYYNSGTLSPDQVQAISISPLVLILPGLMVDLAVFLLFTSVQEFTVAQAPLSMRGMIIGVFYFLYGFYTLLGLGYRQIFVSQLTSLTSLPSLYSCCSLYYTIGSIISLLITVLTFRTTHKYVYRERSEIINEYQFIENYYTT